MRGPCGCRDSVPYAHKARPTAKCTGVMNVRNSYDFGKMAVTIFQKSDVKMMHPRTSWESCDNYVIKLYILMASYMLHIFTV